MTLTSETVAVYVDAPPLNDVNRQLLNIIEVYEQNGSGCFFSNFVSLRLALLHLDPLKASAFVPLPIWIKARRAVVNIRGSGNDCFKWAVLAGMYPVEANAHRTSQYTEQVGKYDFSSLHFPVPLSSVGSFATTNDMSINAYGVDDDNKVIYPLRVSSTLVPDRHVDLLLFERNGIQHYTTIRNFRSRQMNSRQMNNHSPAVYCCQQCIHAYSTQELLDADDTDCCHAQRTKFPNYPRCRFTNIQKQLPPPFVVYADFESILKPFDTDVATTQGVEAGGESSSRHIT